MPPPLVSSRDKAARDWLTEGNPGQSSPARKITKMNAKIAAVIAALSFGALSVPVAHADDQNGYIAYLNSHGTSTSGEEGEGQAIAVGRLQCEKMEKGVSEVDTYVELRKTMSASATPSPMIDATNIVHGAHRYLCPDAPVAFRDSFPK